MSKLPHFRAKTRGVFQKIPGVFPGEQCRPNFMVMVYIHMIPFMIFFNAVARTVFTQQHSIYAHPPWICSKLPPPLMWDKAVLNTCDAKNKFLVFCAAITSSFESEKMCKTFTENRNKCWTYANVAVRTTDSTNHFLNCIVRRSTSLGAAVKKRLELQHWEWIV